MSEGKPRQPTIFNDAFLAGVEDVTQLIFVRHGEQDIDRTQPRPRGENVDPPLSDRGRRQVQLVGERFSTQRIDAVYVSPLQRARDTGFEIARHHRIEPVVVPDLREVEVYRDIPGDRTVVDVLGRPLVLGVQTRMFQEKRWDVYPHSESSYDFRKRTINAVEGIIAENEGKRVVVACHGGVINSYLAHIIGSPYDMFFMPAHASVHVVAAAPNGVRALHSLNDIHHLLHPEGDSVSH